MQYSRDFVDTVNAVVDELDHILMGIPALEVYVQIFGASNIRLLEEPLVSLYAALMNFGIEAAKLFDGTFSRFFDMTDRLITWIGKKRFQSQDMKHLISKVEKAEKRVQDMALAENMVRIKHIEQTQEGTVCNLRV